MRESKVASRYAKALFDYAAEEKILDQVREDMDVIYDLSEASRHFRLFLQSPVIRKDKKLAVINEIFKPHISKQALTYLQIIVRKSREAYIPGIALDFIHLHKEHQGIKLATLVTAAPVDEDVRKKVILFLERRTKFKIELHEQTDPSLIGGFVIKIENFQYDASLLRQFKRLKREFDVNIFVKGF
jgi:F-type H+-transporting ATPase subunit delta